MEETHEDERKAWSLGLILKPGHYFLFCSPYPGLNLRKYGTY